jgi:hypothetical protein
MACGGAGTGPEQNGNTAKGRVAMRRGIREAGAFILGGAFVLANAGGSGAEEATAVASADVAVLSAYVWRGQVLNDEAVVQPALTVVKGGFSVNAWGNFNLTDAATGEDAEFSEVDLTVSYSRPVWKGAIGAGLLEYLFPNQTLAGAGGQGVGYPGTREVFLTASLGSLPAAPSLAVYYDFGEADSFYWLASLAHSASIGKSLVLSASASIGYGAAGYNKFYFGVDDAAFNDDASVGVSLAWSAVPRLTVTPACQFVTIADPDIADAADDLYKDKHRTVFSVKTSYAF